jgi:hypothetical protein
MFTLSAPPQSYKTDATIVDGGIRFSDDFIKREHLQDYKSVWVFVDRAKNRLGLKFHMDYPLQSIKISSAGKSTVSKLIWCSYLKKYSPVKLIMEDNNIENRRFSVKKLDELSDKSEKVEYEIDLSEYGKPFNRIAR